MNLSMRLKPRLFERINFAVLLVLLTLSVGCKPDLIPNTDLRDNKVNRTIVDFMVTYRKALESQSVSDLMGLVAEDYFEDNGTAEQDDDYGYKDLQQRLTQSFEPVDEVFLNFFIQHVEFDETRTKIRVIYRFLERAKVKLPSGEEWFTESDVNEMWLRTDDDDELTNLQIISGL